MSQEMRSASSQYQEVRYEYSSDFPEILGHICSSLMVSTYQAGKLAVISPKGDELDFSFVNFDTPMGVAVTSDELAIGSKFQIWFLKRATELATQVSPEGLYDDCFLTRSSFVTGNIQGHELAWSGRELWVVNTLFSCLATLNAEYTFVPRWRPPFVAELVAADVCHLNGLAIADGEPKLVTAHGASSEPGGWREKKASGGVLMDVPSNEIVACDLSMPHSPRVYQERSWLLDSGRGEFVTVDIDSGMCTTVAQMPGFTRGLSFCGQFAFIGLSKIRESAVFGGLPIATSFDELKCGVGVIDLLSGNTVATLQFHSGVEEIFDVQVLPGSKSPILCGPNPADDDQDPIWLLPQAE